MFQTLPILARGGPQLGHPWQSPDLPRRLPAERSVVINGAVTGDTASGCSFGNGLVNIDGNAGVIFKNYIVR